MLLKAFKTFTRVRALTEPVLTALVTFRHTHMRRLFIVNVTIETRTFVRIGAISKNTHLCTFRQTHVVLIGVLFKLVKAITLIWCSAGGIYTSRGAHGVTGMFERFVSSVAWETCTFWSGYTAVAVDAGVTNVVASAVAVVGEGMSWQAHTSVGCLTNGVDAHRVTHWDALVGLSSILVARAALSQCFWFRVFLLK